MVQFAKAVHTAARKSLEAKFQKQFFKTSMCAKFKVGQCNRGHFCKFAHSEEDVRTRPCLDKTKMCPKLQACVYRNCRFAHTRDELSATTNFAKTKMCHFGEKCMNGSSCRYAHSEKELVDADKKPKKVYFVDEEEEEHRDRVSFTENSAFTMGTSSLSRKSSSLTRKSSAFSRKSFGASIKNMLSSASGTYFTSPLTFDMRTNSRGSSLYGSPYALNFALSSLDFSGVAEFPAANSGDRFGLPSPSAVEPTLMDMLGEPSAIPVSNNTMTFDCPPSDTWRSTESNMMPGYVRGESGSPSGHPSAIGSPMHISLMTHTTTPNDLNNTLFMLSNQFENTLTVPAMIPTPVASGNPGMMRNDTQ
eukprot:GEMP01039874.1.p1 GENE.GEMP01039874.1~~GEMP01039874.1.p1  ORF type:complete len:362 (+),score=56.16 GEMP01039874.1:119-1204(+)